MGRGEFREKPLILRHPSLGTHHWHPSLGPIDHRCRTAISSSSLDKGDKELLSPPWGRRLSRSCGCRRRQP
ncbi:hypothetical protein Hamer_G028351 [Homarus americanus]|uniref:Uncharacterized protein n=1 Tax=Homarus americanus TaxID=6706 RepID=A0A8J5MS03_HOMAM|nr:hypothetical protein Hamer_G028351 [Homarus americanus]